MKLLIMINNEVTIDPHAIGIKEFEIIWNADTDSQKTQAKRELSLIYNQCHWDTVYKVYTEEERLKVLQHDILGDQEIPPRVIDAIGKYKEIQAKSNPSIIFLDEHIDVMMSLRKYYKNIDWGARDLKGNLLYKPKEVTTAMKDAEVVIKKCKTLREDIMKDEADLNTVRGGVEVGQFSK